MARLVSMLLALGLIGLLGCQEEAPTGPTNADFSAARKELAEKLKKGKKKVVRKQQPAEAAGESEETAFATVDRSYRYESKGKRDPFRSFEWERPDRLVDDATRSPLERYDLAQLDVVAVVWETNNAKALVIDPSGQSYVVGQGARLGKNQGFVKAIKDNHVVVKETYVDHLGQKSTKDIEMRMRGSEGG